MKVALRSASYIPSTFPQQTAAQGTVLGTADSMGRHSRDPALVGLTISVGEGAWPTINDEVWEWAGEQLEVRWPR